MAPPLWAKERIKNLGPLFDDDTEASETMRGHFFYSSIVCLLGPLVMSIFSCYLGILMSAGPSPDLEQTNMFLLFCSGPGAWGPGPFGPGPVWTQARLTRARLGPGSFGPGPVWPGPISLSGPIPKIICMAYAYPYPHAYLYPYSYANCLSGPIGTWLGQEGYWAHGPLARGEGALGPWAYGLPKTGSPA